MCGRFTLHTPESRRWEAFHLEPAAPLGLKLRYNIAPSQSIPIIRDTDAGREMVMTKWGLVPHWSKEPKTKYSTINARIESVADKPAYRNAFKHHRCLIPADGFYEWKVVDGRKVPHHIRMRDGDVFALAGLWDRWEGEGESLESCSIIVMPANEVMNLPFTPSAESNDLAAPIAAPSLKFRALRAQHPVLRASCEGLEAAISSCPHPVIVIRLSAIKRRYRFSG